MERRGQIICAECGVGPERPFERDGAMWARCPNCGQEARIADIQCEAIEQHIHISRRARGSMIAARSEPRRDYRWTVCG
jgi:hypothetical protein